MRSRFLILLIILSLIVQTTGFSAVHAAEKPDVSAVPETGEETAGDTDPAEGETGEESTDDTDPAEEETGEESAEEHDAPAGPASENPSDADTDPVPGEASTELPAEEEEDGSADPPAPQVSGEAGAGSSAESVVPSSGTVIDAQSAGSSQAEPLLLSMIDAEISYDDVSPTWGGDLMGLSEACEKASRSSFNGRTVTVAVLDTGINASHERFAGRLLGGKSFVDGESYDSDASGHGTHIAGIIAANTPANVKIMPLKVLNADKKGSAQGVYDAILYAASNGADIINLSLGVSRSSFTGADGSFASDDYDLYDSTLGAAISSARSRGCIVITSAGNEGRDIGEAGSLPASCSGSITVSALSADGSLYDKSNYGGAVDFCAPGEAIYSSYAGGSSSYEKLSGTSMAVPFISSAYALIMLYNPDIAGDAGALTGLLSESCEDRGDSDLYGAGLPVFDGGIVPGDRPERPKVQTVVCREDSITLKWNDRDGISFDIYKKQEGASGFEKAGTSDSGVFTDRNVAFNQSYVYYIEAGETGHYSVSDRSEEAAGRAYVPVTGISCRTYNPYDLVLTPGRSQYLYAAPVPVSASFPKMIWESENPEIAAVDDSGKVTAVSEGTTKILIRSEDDSYTGSESYEVKVVRAENCGEDLYWYYDGEEKRLLILGEGDMFDFSQNGAPWFSLRFQIEKITFGESVTGVGEYAFTGITVKEIEGMEHIRRIGASAFRAFTCYNDFAPAADVQIAPGAFEGAKLQRLVIPAGLTLPDSFFSGSSFGGFEAAQDSTSYLVRDDVLFSADTSRLIRFPYSESGSYTIPDTVKELAPGAFKGCTLTEVEVPASIGRIPDSAFESCRSLKKAELKGTVTSIGAKAFYCCTKLEVPQLSSGLTYIGPYAFYRTEFPVLELPPSLTEIGKYALAGMRMTEVRIPEGVTSLGEGALQYASTYLRAVYLPASLKKIGKQCFFNTFDGTELHYNGFTRQFHAIDGQSDQDYQWSSLIVDTGGETGSLTWRAYGRSGHVTLTISGTGALPDYRTDADCPWSAGRDEIEKVVIKEGVTYLGRNSLCQMPSLRTIELPCDLAGRSANYGYGLFLGDKALDAFICTAPDRDSITVRIGYLYAQFRDQAYAPPVIVRTAEGADLSPDGEYSVSYQDTAKPGQGAVRIDILTDPEPSGPLCFPFLIITEKLDGTDIRTLSAVELIPDTFAYDGREHLPNIVVKSGIYTLHKGSDYRLTCPEHCTEPGTYKVTATGIGIYSGTRSATFVIRKTGTENKAQGADSGQKEAGDNAGSSSGDTAGSSSGGAKSAAESSGASRRGTGKTQPSVSGGEGAGSGRGSAAESAAGGSGLSSAGASSGNAEENALQSTQKEPSPEEKAPSDSRKDRPAAASRIMLLVLSLAVLYFLIVIFRVLLHRE